MAQQPPPGQYPPPEGQYPPQGGTYPPQGPPPPPGAPGGFPPPAPPAKKSNTGKIVGGIIGVVVLVCGGIALRVGLSSVFDGSLDAEPGECITDAVNPDDIEIVDCTSAEAAYKVTSVQDSPGTDDTLYCPGDTETDGNYLAEGDSTYDPDTVYCLVALS